MVLPVGMGEDVITACYLFRIEPLGRGNLTVACRFSVELERSGYGPAGTVQEQLVHTNLMSRRPVIEFGMVNQVSASVLCGKHGIMSLCTFADIHKSPMVVGSQ